MEEETAADRRICLYSKVAQKRLQALGKPVVLDRIAIVPDNLLFTGGYSVPGINKGAKCVSES